jgi:hypothetical protein
VSCRKGLEEKGMFNPEDQKNKTLGVLRALADNVEAGKFADAAREILNTTFGIPASPAEG